MTEAGMRSRWRWTPLSSDQQQASSDLAAAVGVHPLLGELLYRRSLKEADQARRFLHPKLTDLHDPKLVPGLDCAAARIVQAIHQHQSIVVYGDYDVDGVTASSILWHTITRLGGKVHCYVPHRLEEGYGLNSEAMLRLCQGDVADATLPSDAEPVKLTDKPLIVSVDCGITAVEPARIAQEHQVDLIITDHHQFDASALPSAYALVHPALPDSRYPFPSICGAGVAFKLAWQIVRHHTGSDRVPSDFKALLLDLVSLAALGTIADIVPLVDENRVLAVFGLGQVKRTQFIGLNALIDASRLRDEKIDAYHVGFVLGPRLNACGRMGHARDAVRLLTAAGAEEAKKTASFLTKENERRRATEKAIFEQAKQMVIDQGYDHPDRRAIVVAQEGWHAGVVGIVASRLVDAFGRPSVVLVIEASDPSASEAADVTEEELGAGGAHGSARSVDGVSIHEAFEHCSEHLTSFGGHAMAAGLKLPASRIDAFRQALVEYVNSKLSPADLVGTTDLDVCCRIHQLDFSLFDQVQKLAPFGRCNDNPILCLRQVTLCQAPVRMGASGKHLRLLLRSGEPASASNARGVGSEAAKQGLGEGGGRGGRGGIGGVQAVWFNADDVADRLVAGLMLDVAFEPKVSTWQGLKRMELHVVDVRIHEPANPLAVNENIAAIALVR